MAALLLASVQALIDWARPRQLETKWRCEPMWVEQRSRRRPPQLLACKRDEQRQLGAELASVIASCVERGDAQRRTLREKRVHSLVIEM